MVDSVRREDLKESSEKFKEIMGFKRVPVLIYLTKQDEGSLAEGEVKTLFELSRLREASRVQCCRGLSGQGIREGFDWLVSQAFPLKTK